MPLVDRSMITPCDYSEFVSHYSNGDYEPCRDDPRFGEENHQWDDFDGLDGRDPNPLLVVPGIWRNAGPVLVSGEIRDGKGYHPAATFIGGELCRLADEVRRSANRSAVSSSGLEPLRDIIDQSRPV